MAGLDKFFALSTCVHCRHAREFLEQNHVDVSPLYVDQQQGPGRQQALDDLRAYNPQLSFPTLVFNDGVVIVGFRPDEISKELGL